MTLLSNRVEGLANVTFEAGRQLFQIAEYLSDAIPDIRINIGIARLAALGVVLMGVGACTPSGEAVDIDVDGYCGIYPLDDPNAAPSNLFPDAWNDIHPIVMLDTSQTFATGDPIMLDLWGNWTFEPKGGELIEEIPETVALLGPIVVADAVLLNLRNKDDQTSISASITFEGEEEG